MLGILGKGTRVTRAARVKGLGLGVKGLGLGVEGLAEKEEEEELKELKRVY